MNMTRLALCLLLSLNLALPATALASGPWHAAGQNTAGWQYMTPDERVEHQRRMRGFNSLAECRAYQEAHHQRMAERAARAGATLRRKAGSGCEQLQQKGKLK